MCVGEACGCVCGMNVNVNMFILFIHALLAYIHHLCGYLHFFCKCARWCFGHRVLAGGVEEVELTSRADVLIAAVSYTLIGFFPLTSNEVPWLPVIMAQFLSRYSSYNPPELMVDIGEI